MIDDPVDELLALFERRGPAHLGEDVSQLDHALQCASAAMRAAAGPELVAAALLHDVGHLVQLERAGGRRLGPDAELVHDRVGEEYLARWFGPEVTAPIGLHVQAKRYLCARELTYRLRLSDESRRRLELQGGPMSRAEVEQFSSIPSAAAAIRLRRWDDDAKVDGVEAPPFSEYRDLLAALVRSTP